MVTDFADTIQDTDLQPVPVDQATSVSVSSPAPAATIRPSTRSGRLHSTTMVHKRPEATLERINPFSTAPRNTATSTPVAATAILSITSITPQDTLISSTPSMPRQTYGGPRRIVFVPAGSRTSTQTTTPVAAPTPQFIRPGSLTTSLAHSASWLQSDW